MVGSALGRLVGIGTLAIPGIGPLIAAKSEGKRDGWTRGTASPIPVDIMSSGPTRRRVRILRILASSLIAIFLLAWTRSPQGAVAFTPFAAEDHVVASRMLDGHIDLVLLHGRSAIEGEPGAAPHRPCAPPRSTDSDHEDASGSGHVVHLCAGGGSAIPGSTLRAPTAIAMLYVPYLAVTADRSHPWSSTFADRPSFAPSSLRSTVLRL